MKIAHDPGHGFPHSDPGACHGGITERDVVLSIAVDVANGIPGHEHRLLRMRPDGPDYGQRAVNAKAFGAQIVFCHHINADSDPHSSGLIAFYNPLDPIGKAVADSAVCAAPVPLVRHANLFAVSNQDWTSRAKWVLDHYRAVGLPAVLIEWGFCTNPGDAAVLLNPIIRPELVAVVAAGISRLSDFYNPERICQ